MACKPYYNYNTNSCGTGRHATNAPTSFPRPPTPPLLPLPAAAASPQYPFQQPASRRPDPRASKKPRGYDAAAPAASAPITVVVAEPSRKRAAAAAELEEESLEWAETAAAAGSLYSVSPPPSSVPMPTSLLLTAAAARKAPTACAVEVAGVDVGATDELRRILRL